MSKAQELQKLRENSTYSEHREFKETNENCNLDDYFNGFLSPKEIEQAVKGYGDNFDKVANEFQDRTKLHKIDYPFLFTAVALQCIRQYVLTAFKERQNAGIGAEIMTNKYGSDGKMTGRYYYAPEKTIIGQKKVPFDIVAGSKKFQLGGLNKGLSGDSHRFRTLGHDPVLGYVFGTANIMTNTMTTFSGASYHIKYVQNAAGVYVPTIYAHADTAKVLSAVWSRVRSEDGVRILAESVVKEYLHLKSDKTTDGLPLPFISSLSPDLAQSLAEHGLDAIHIAEVGKQTAMSCLVNAIIAIVHGMLCAEQGELNRNLYKVRTRKILLYSNLIASSSNILYCAISENWKKLDVGGTLTALYRLYADPKFIDKLKYEFINNELSGMYTKKCGEYAFYFED